MTVEEHQARIAEAIEAACVIVRLLGGDARDPELVHDGANAVVRFPAIPAMARVTTATEAVRGDAAMDHADREMTLLRFLGREGVAVVAPSNRIPAGPHRDGRSVVTFFAPVDHDRDRPLDGAKVGRALRRLHGALRRFKGDLPRLGPVQEIGRVAALLEARGVLPAVEAARMAREAERAIAAIDALDLPSQALHGDAHLGNVLRTPAGPLWTDLEDACRGPIAWDLACLVATARQDRRPSLEIAERALASAVDVVDEATLSPFLAARRLQAVAWVALLAADRPELAELSRTRLASWRAQPF